MKQEEIIHLREQLSDIYRDYRNFCLTRLFYGRRVCRVRNFNRTYEIALALGTSSAIGGLAFWKEPPWQIIWTVVGVLVAVLTVLKPILNLSKEIERLSNLESTYAGLQLDLQLLVFEIKSKRTLSDGMREQYRATFDKLKSISALEDPQVPPEIIDQLKAEVQREIPTDSLWSPK